MFSKISIVVAAVATIIFSSSAIAETDTSSMWNKSSMGETNYVYPSADSSLTLADTAIPAVSKRPIKATLTKADSIQINVKKLGFKDTLSNKAMEKIFQTINRVEAEEAKIMAKAKTDSLYHANTPQIISQSIPLIATGW
jgi:hypothetical protein